MTELSYRETVNNYLKELETIDFDKVSLKDLAIQVHRQQTVINLQELFIDKLIDDIEDLKGIVLGEKNDN